MGQMSAPRRKGEGKNEKGRDAGRRIKKEECGEPSREALRASGARRQAWSRERRQQSVRCAPGGPAGGEGIVLAGLGADQGHRQELRGEVWTEDRIHD